LQIFLIANGLLGYICFPLLANVGGTGGAAISLSTPLMVSTANLFLIFASVVGVSAAWVVGKSSSEYRVESPAIVKSAVSQTVTIVFAAVILGMNVAVRGVGWLWFRSDRFQQESTQILSLLSMLSLVAVVALGVAIVGPSVPRRALAWVLVSGYMAVYFSLASRTLTLIPLLLLIGSFIAGARNRMLLKISVVLFLTALLAPIPLFTRGLGAHGIQPYLAALPSLSYSGDAWLEVLNNTLTGFGIVGETAFSRPPIPREVMLISLTPIGGERAGWYDVAPALRLNYFTPYGALGEMGNAGWLFVVVFAVALGLSLGFIQRSGRYLTGFPVLSAWHLAAVGLTFLFVVQLTQYNLRSEMRLLYYALSIDIVLNVASILLGSEWSKTGEGRVGRWGQRTRPMHQAAEVTK
jgi:hypothetical protein